MILIIIIYVLDSNSNIQLKVREDCTLGPTEYASLLAESAIMLIKILRLARVCRPGFGISQGLGFRVWGLGLRVQGLGFRVQGLGFRA